MNIEEKEDYDAASPTYYQSEQTIQKSTFMELQSTVHHVIQLENLLNKYV